MTMKANIMIHGNENNKPVTLESKDYVKYLRILIDSHLTFKYHIEHVTVKISKNVGMLAKLRHLVPRKTLQLRCVVSQANATLIKFYVSKNERFDLYILQKEMITLYLFLSMLVFCL